MPFILDGLLNCADFLCQRLLIVSGQINDHSIHCVDRCGGQFFSQAERVGPLRYAIQPFQSRENQLQLLLSQQRMVHFESVRNGDPTAIALGGHKWNTRLANVLNVSVDGSPGYLKPLRQLRSGDLVLLQ